jgi:hypothetical protein
MTKGLFRYQQAGGMHFISFSRVHNPVKRGLVNEPEEWPWSSFRHYATGVAGTVEIERFWTAAGREGFIQSQVSKARPGAPVFVVGN